MNKLRNLKEGCPEVESYIPPVEPVVMVPYLKNRADAVDGHYCIARLHPQGYHEYWNEKLKEWCSVGTVFELGKAMPAKLPLTLSGNNCGRKKEKYPVDWTEYSNTM